MPYVSEAQRGYFHAHKAELEKQGVNVDEWDQASKGQTNLPDHVPKDHPLHKLRAQPKGHPTGTR